MIMHLTLWAGSGPPGEGEEMRGEHGDGGRGEGPSQR